MKTLNLKEAEQFITDLTAEQCDEIALLQGSMSIRVVGEKPAKHLTRGRCIDGWTLFWLPVSKTPWTWQLTLGASTARTHQVAKEGRINRLVNYYDFDRDAAERYTQAAWGVQYGYVDEVITTVKEADAHRNLWERFPGPSPAIPFWLNVYGTYKHINHGKLVAANKIIKTLWGEEEVTADGIRTVEVYNSRHFHQIPVPMNHGRSSLVSHWS